MDSENSNCGFDDSGVATTARLTLRAQSPMWRQTERDWLVAAVPRFAGDEWRLRLWLASLEHDYGINAVTDAISAAKPYVESGDVKNVQAYITETAKKMAVKSRNARGFQ